MKYNIDKELKSLSIFSGACHGYEAVLKSAIVEKCMNRRIEWIKKVYENYT